MDVKDRRIARGVETAVSYIVSAGVFAAAVLSVAVLALVPLALLAGVVRLIVWLAAGL